MEVSLALLADYANVTREGKLNIMGVFDIIRAKTYPAMHPSMQMIMVFEATNVEIETERSFRVMMEDVDGNKLYEVGGPLNFNKGKPGEVNRANHIVKFDMLKIPKEGDYNFSIYINNDFQRSVTLKALKLQ